MNQSRLPTSYGQNTKAKSDLYREEAENEFKSVRLATPPIKNLPAPEAAVLTLMMCDCGPKLFNVSTVYLPHLI